MNSLFTFNEYHFQDLLRRHRGHQRRGPRPLLRARRDEAGRRGGGRRRRLPHSERPPHEGHVAHRAHLLRHAGARLHHGPLLVQEVRRKGIFTMLA